MSEIDEKDPRLVEAQIARLDAAAELDRRRTEHEIEDIEWSRKNRTEMLAKAKEHNIYTFLGQVDGMSAAAAMSNLGEMSRARPGDQIEIVFNSPGGSVFAGLALYDFIQSLKDAGHFVITSTVGMAASMGGILLQAGSERVAGANSFMLIHEVSNMSMGKTSEMEESLAFQKKLQERLINILASRSVLSEQEIKDRWEKKDWWLDSQEMLDLGFIDRIR